MKKKKLITKDKEITIKVKWNGCITNPDDYMVYKNQCISFDTGGTYRVTRDTKINEDLTCELPVVLWRSRDESKS